MFSRKTAPGRRMAAWVSLAAASLLAVSACSSSDGKKTSAAGNHGPVTVTVWSWGSPAKTLPTLTAEFEKVHPDIHINLVNQPFASYFTQLQTAVASKKGPDVVFMYAGPAVFDTYRGLLPLTKYVTDEQRKDLQGWNLNSTGLADNGTPYAMPWSAQGTLFYYNKALFKKAGLDPNAPPTTLDSLINTCQTLKAHGVTPFADAWKDGADASWVFDFFAAQYMTAQQAANPDVDWTDPNIVKGVQAAVQMVKGGCTQPGADGINEFPDGVNQFSAGKGAMHVGLAANTDNYTQFRPTLKNDLGVFLPPTVPGSVHPQGSWFDYGAAFGLGITKWSKVPDAAYEWMSYLTSPESQAKAFELDGSLPNTSLAQISSSYAPAQQILGWLKTATPFPGPFTLMRTNPGNTLTALAPNLITGRMSPADGMKQVQQSQTQLPPLPKG